MCPSELSSLYVSSWAWCGSVQTDFSDSHLRESSGGHLLWRTLEIPRPPPPPPSLSWENKTPNIFFSCGLKTQSPQCEPLEGKWVRDILTHFPGVIVRFSSFVCFSVNQTLKKNLKISRGHTVKNLKIYESMSSSNFKLFPGVLTSRPVNWEAWERLKG